MSTEPTTCTVCGERYTAPLLVSAFAGERLCSACEERSKNDRRLVTLEAALESAQATVDYWTKVVYAHKTAHAPVVVTGQGTSRKEWHG